MRPAEAVDDVAVLGPQLDRLLDHLEAAFEILAAVDPRIAEIIEHHRLVGLQLERVQEIALGALPLARAFERDAAVVKQRPALGQAGCGGAADRLVISRHRFGKPLLAAQDVAELDLGPDQPGAFGGHRLELGDRFVAALERVEIDRAAQPRRPGIGRAGRNLGQYGEAFLGLVLGAQNVGEQQLGERELRPQGEGEAVVEQRQIDRLRLVRARSPDRTSPRRGRPPASGSSGGGVPAGCAAITDSARSLPLFCWMKRW